MPRADRKYVAAFPFAAGNEVFSGMSLRDYFAGQALHGTLSDSNNLESMLREIEKEKVATPDLLMSVLASSCYQLADAMMEEREK